MIDHAPVDLIEPVSTAQDTGSTITISRVVDVERLAGFFGREFAVEQIRNPFVSFFEFDNFGMMVVLSREKSVELHMKLNADVCLADFVRRFPIFTRFLASAYPQAGFIITAIPASDLNVRVVANACGFRLMRETELFRIYRREL